MNIRPIEDWYWYFDDKLDSLMIDLSQGILFRSRLTRKMIVIDALEDADFSIADASLFYQFSESCQSLPLPEPHKVELILNAIAAHNYLKPIMPKSWYFSPQSIPFVANKGDLAMAEIEKGNDHIHLLVIDSSATASLCLIADPRVQLADKIFYLGNAIKVMHNRLLPYACCDASESYYDQDQDDPLRHFLNKVC